MSPTNGMNGFESNTVGHKTSNGQKTSKQGSAKKKYKKKKYDFTIVTGANKNHFCPMKGFLYNLNDIIKGLNARLIVYDLGFLDKQRREMMGLMNRGYLNELRVFNYKKYPSFWNISEANGEYAWKPGIVAEVSKDYPGIIIWLDSGTFPQRRYFEILNPLLNKYNGFLSPRSPGSMKMWTHPGVYVYYKDDASKYNKFPNCNAASIAFDTKKVQHLIDEWYSCALNKDCIAPAGSSRENHRQDQSVLTYLAIRAGYYCFMEENTLSIVNHQDNKCYKIITMHEKIKYISKKSKH